MEKWHSRNGYQTTRVLLVDSEKSICDTVRLALIEEGLEVICLSDGRTAWEELYLAERQRHSDRQNFPFHLIVLDAVLPGMNGLEICRFVRARRNPVPILMISHKNSEEDKVLGLEMGADDYLTKPFHLRELVARCRCLLRSHLNYLCQPTVLSFGDIRLYPDEYRVEIQGQPVNLPLQEFRILQLFLKHPQQILTQAELIKQVWGNDREIHPKTLRAYIERLRKKIESNPKAPQYIKTARGKGYCLGSIQ
ncbi:response regulator transcription factor [Thermocoleostomius sinensis]|uniref:Response regulator transcription factor n=1 Tax=Thermocoleostomius sinensis A174 TaxID=2016057 RepID=A0A9E9C6T7_9CYAN|nr:response regulator transcription factor [Thermocoleostomius sinensis]WAL59614.1 response regulator transcription factor [Thermocoleostomius sinensis A174]